MIEEPLCTCDHALGYHLSGYDRCCKRVMIYGPNALEQCSCRRFELVEIVSDE